MNLYSAGVDPKLDLHDMDKIVSVVRECTQIDVHPRQPYSGDLVFTAFSGSHQDAIKKCLDIYEEGAPWEIAYLPIDPRDIGRTYQDVIRVNSQSGKGGVAYVLANKFGFELPRWLQIEFSRVVQSVTEKSGGEIQPDSIWTLFSEHYLKSEKVISLEDFSIQKNKGREKFDAMLELNGQPIELSGEGDGVLDAFIGGLKRALDVDFEVMEYGEHALGQGADAEAVTYIQLKYGVRRFSGVAISKDIIASSLNALMGAVSELLKETAAQTADAAQRDAG
jgi:2-isopropylmalate synthase